MKGIVYEIDLLDTLACLCAKIVRISDLTEQVIAALLIASRRHIVGVTTVLVP
jgi:hypothetical protein